MNIISNYFSKAVGFRIQAEYKWHSRNKKNINVSKLLCVFEIADILRVLEIIIAQF